MHIWQALPAAVLVLALGGCATANMASVMDKVHRSEAAIVPRISQSDLKQCAANVTKFTGTFGNSVYKLTGPLRLDSRFGCVERSRPEHPVAYYVAPAELVSGYGGIFQPKETKFLWCRYKLENNTVILDTWSIGMRVNRYAVRGCGLH